MSEIYLYADPQTPPMTWDAFCLERPKFSIALDGYVADGPRYDPLGTRINFNHHEGVSRLETRCTCAQVLMAIRLGLFDKFRSERGQPTANVWVNDCDEDVCTAWWLLKHHYIADNPINPIVNRLVFIEDMLDTTAGSFPYPQDLPLLEQLAWVYEPYRLFRQSNRLGAKDKEEYKSIILDVERRISAHIVGEGESRTLNGQYEIIGGGEGWIMAKEIGAHAKAALLGAGHKAYVLLRGRPDGRTTAVVGKLSPFIDYFDIPRIISDLNEVEGTAKSEDRWGGGSVIAGSPRVSGSKLSASVIQDVVNKALQ